MQILPSKLLAFSDSLLLILPLLLSFPPIAPHTYPPPTMSVVGIDFGAQSTKIGVARNKGIDIVCVCPAEPSLVGELLPVPCHFDRSTLQERVAMN